MRAWSRAAASALTPADPRWVTPLRSIVKDAMPERLSTAIWRPRVDAVVMSTSPLTTMRPVSPTRDTNSELTGRCWVDRLTVASVMKFAGPPQAVRQSGRRPAGVMGDLGLGHQGFGHRQSPPAIPLALAVIFPLPMVDH